MMYLIRLDVECAHLLRTARGDGGRACDRTEKKEIVESVKREKYDDETSGRAAPRARYLPIVRIPERTGAKGKPMRVSRHRARPRCCGRPRIFSSRTPRVVRSMEQRTRALPIEQRVRDR